ncbi:MAG: hypothetical protein H3Z51_04055, partial [archaeon]|nr:hypothetical protein [archaeon]
AGKRRYRYETGAEREELKEKIADSGEQYGLLYLIKDDERSKMLIIDNVFSTAKCMVPQTEWYNMLRAIKSERKIRDKLDQIFKERDSVNKASLIDELKEFKTKLTPLQAVPLNAMLFCYDPDSHVSVVSLNHRYQVIKAFQLGEIPANASYGTRVVQSNELMRSLNKQLGLEYSPRKLSSLCYWEPIQELWKIERPPPPEGELPSFKLDDFNTITEYIRSIDRIARRDFSLKVDNFQNRFEDVVYSIFRIMQLEVEQRGYKKTGEEQPDGIIKVERNLLIPYDCKSSEKPYDLTINDRRGIEAHVKNMFDEFKNIDFKMMIVFVISHTFETSAIRHANELGDKLEWELGKPVKIALVTTEALIRLLGKVIAEGRKLQIFGKFKGLIDKSQIEELWRTL